MSETLEPCPWCGGTDLTDDFTSGGYLWMHVRCRCGACGPGIAMQDDHDAVRAAARAAWNRRADDARGHVIAYAGDRPIGVCWCGES